jgi:hypothetical protein
MISAPVLVLFNIRDLELCKSPSTYRIGHRPNAVKLNFSSIGSLQVDHLVLFP